jgi:hypothetical protein
MNKVNIFRLLGLICLLSFALVANAAAKVSAEDAARLGKDLTPLGAEMAGNADGSIPAWDGGLKQTPDHKTGDRHLDPFADEKPLYSITAANMAQYADKVSAGQKALFEKYPDDFRMDIYPTHRTHSAPQWVYDNTKINATTADLVGDGNGVEGAWGGTPFPLPKNGAEVIWNHHFRWASPGNIINMSSYVINSNGSLDTVGGAKVWQRYPMYVGSRDDNEGEVYNLFISYNKPARRKGEVILIRDPLNQAENPRKGWQYLVGQRRVRRAPTVAYDTPNVTFSGLSTYDDAFIFNGAMDRYDWKLVGKQEIYIPYNTYKMDTYTEDPSTIFTPKHVNPDYLRWELHRVWVVEANLKEGKRHVYAKRTFYVDEDSWVIPLSDSYDGRGTLWRTALSPLKNASEVPATVQRMHIYYDLNKGQYAVNNCQNEEKIISKYGADVVKPRKFYTPEQVRRLGKR